MSHLGQFTFSQTFDDDNDPDYVYYNGSIINNRSSATDVLPDPPIQFLETRDVPIVKDASKYNFSIVRFTMNGANKDLPLFIPVIRTGTANPTNNVNLTIYSVSLRISVDYTVAGIHYEETFDSTMPLEWIPETTDEKVAPIPIPSTCQTGQDISTRYYWCYTYSHWMRIFKLASQLALADIQNQFNIWYLATVPGAVAPAPTLKTHAPEFSFNPTSGLFTLYCDQYSFGRPLSPITNPAEVEVAQIWFNNNLFGLFSNFDNIYENDGERTNRIIVPDILGQNTTIATDIYTGTTYTCWVVQQDYESTSTLWSPIESIVFTSSLLPLVFEQIADPVRFGEGNDNTFANGRPAFAPIITDVALTNENANAYRSYIQYSPQAEYRMASFQRSKSPINQIDIQVYWKNRLDGQLYPIQMFNCSSVSVKIMLRRRGVYDYPHPAKSSIDL